jgi:large subunit ribosomal protein L24
MAKSHVRRGEEVVVIAGTEQGKRGKVIRVLPHRQQVIVEGVKIIKKHQRKNRDHPQGAIIEREGPIHLSNVMRADRYDARVAKRAAGAPAAPAAAPAA